MISKKKKKKYNWIDIDEVYNYFPCSEKQTQLK